MAENIGKQRASGERHLDLEGSNTIDLGSLMIISKRIVLQPSNLRLRFGSTPEQFMQLYMALTSMEYLCISY